MRTSALATLFVLTLLEACASSSTNSAAPDGSRDGKVTDGGGAASTCTSQDFQATKLAAGETLVDMAHGSDGAWLLLKGSEGSLAFQQPGGERHEVEAKGVTGAAISPRSDGKVCAIWAIGSPGVDAKIRYACAPSFDVEDTGVAMGMADEYPVAFRDGPSGAAAVFAERNALDGIERDANGNWSNANLMESSISFGGGPRALTRAEGGAPYCYIQSGTAVFESWGLSGSANEIARIPAGSKTTFYTDTGCAVAETGGNVGLLTVGGGKAKFALHSQLETLDPRDLDAADIETWTFGAQAGVFSAIYTKGGSVYRARVTAEDTGSSPIGSTSVVLPNGAKATGGIALAFDAQGTEHLAVQSTESVLYARTCASEASSKP